MVRGNGHVAQITTASKQVLKDQSDIILSGYLGVGVGSSVNLRLVQDLSFSHSQPTASEF